MKMVFGKKKEGIIFDDPNAYSPASAPLPQEVMDVANQVKGQPAVPSTQVQFQPPMAYQQPVYRPQRAQVLGKIISMNLESEGKKEWVVVKMVLDDKSASMLKIGQVTVIQ
jgi:hypothetical protein